MRSLLSHVTDQSLLQPKTRKFDIEVNILKGCISAKQNFACVCVYHFLWVKCLILAKVKDVTEISCRKNFNIAIKHFMWTLTNPFRLMTM